MKSKANILIVDDDADIREALYLFLKDKFESVYRKNSPKTINSILDNESIDVILLDMNFNPGRQTGEEGLYWLQKIIAKHKEIKVLLLTAYGNIDLAVEGMRIGAYDFITKPWDNEKLLSSITNAIKLKTTEEKVSSLKEQQKQFFSAVNDQSLFIWGKSPVMMKLQNEVFKAAQSDASVLIIGENGTGKDLVARELHRLSSRNDKAFIKVDVGSLSETVFESEMFGHIKGAYTDAKEDRMGRFEAANGGTLFLDEIGNLSLYLQAKLLSPIQNMEIVRMGTNNLTELDVRIISATNKDLNKLVKDDLFRQDLLYRLNTICIEVPPLRNRLDDIILLAQTFVDKFKLKYNKPEIKIGQECFDKLKEYQWPGNVRELEHEIEKAMIMCDTSILTANDVLTSGKSLDTTTKFSCLKLDELEKLAIIEALKKHKYHLTLTAKELGISRPTLYKKISKYNINI